VFFCIHMCVPFSLRLLVSNIKRHLHICTVCVPFFTQTQAPLLPLYGVPVAKASEWQKHYHVIRQTHAEDSKDHFYLFVCTGCFYNRPVQGPEDAQILVKHTKGCIGKVSTFIVASDASASLRGWRLSSLCKFNFPCFRRILIFHGNYRLLYVIHQALEFKVDALRKTWPQCFEKRKGPHIVHPRFFAPPLTADHNLMNADGFKVVRREDVGAKTAVQCLACGSLHASVDSYYEHYSTQAKKEPPRNGGHSKSGSLAPKGKTVYDYITTYVRTHFIIMLSSSVCACVLCSVRRLQVYATLLVADMRLQHVVLLFSSSSC
jgi:hypothetical protein